ncbi:MAG: hypothetical protein AB7P78_08815 [Candidatus Binatia bacterium]
MSAAARGSAHHLITLRQAAEIGPLTPGEILRKIRTGVLLAGVHYATPRGTRPLIIRDAFAAYLAGADHELIAEHERQQRRPSGKVNWDAMNQRAG